MVVFALGCVRGVGHKRLCDSGVKAAGTCSTSVWFPTQTSCFPYKIPTCIIFFPFPFSSFFTHTHTHNMSSSVLSQPFHTMDNSCNTTTRPDNFSDTSSNSIPTTPALPKEHDLMKKSNTFMSEDVDNYATAEHVAAWLPLDDDPTKDSTTTSTKSHDILIDAIPPLPAKATRLPAPAAIWKTWDSPTLLPWGNDSIWKSSNKHRRFSTSLPPPPPLLSSMGTATTTTTTTPKRRTSTTTLSSSSIPYHRRSSFPDTVLSTTDQSKKDYWQSLISGDLDRYISHHLFWV